MTTAGEPAISAVIPLYNKEKYVRRAVDSVLAQSFGEFELIVVNDGSTDNGPAIVSAYRDLRIRLIHQENRGVSAARNRGIKEAKGELIAFLDADDEWCPDFLDTIVRLEEKFPNAGAYATGFRLLKGGRHIFRDLHISRRRDECGCYFDLLRKGAAVNSSCIAVRRSVFDSVGVFREGYKRGEDIDLWFRIGVLHKFAFSPRICSLYYYYLPDNACHTTVLCATPPLYISFLQIRDDPSVPPRVREKAARYLSHYLAEDAHRVFLSGTRDAACRRLREYRFLFGPTCSYARLLLLSMVPVVLLRLFVLARLRTVGCLLSLKSAVLRMAHSGIVDPRAIRCSLQRKVR
jgi:glycosyltransferase involved in cell wall biosynthesis